MAERIAILCIANNYGPPRTARALTKSGVEVCIVAPPDSYAALTRFKHADLLISSQEIQVKLPSIMALLADEYRADYVLAGDDIAFAALMQFLARLPSLAVSEAVRALVARSMPTAAQAATLARGSEMVMTRKRSVCPPPPSIANPSSLEAERFAMDVGFPALVKRDGFSSGRGIALCNTPDQLNIAIAAAETAQSPFTQGFVVQKLLPGATYGVSVAGLRGKCVAAFSFRKLIVHPSPFGPTAVAKPDRREDIIADATEIFETTGLTGFAGFDYVVDEGGKARFLEVNPRIMPTTHLGDLFGADLVNSLLAHMRRQSPPAIIASKHDEIALFPNEWLRDPESHRRYAYRDDPLDDPAVHTAMVLGKG